MSDIPQYELTVALQSAVFHPFDGHPAMPAQMNSPFYYEPHPLCLEARRQALPLIKALMQDETEGKMFGVLIVERSEDGACGYLAGYSGQIRGRSDWPGFVPAVFDYLQPDGYFKRHEAAITAINRQVEQLEQQPERLQALEALAEAKREAGNTLSDMQRTMFEARERRRARRAEGGLTADEEAVLIRESQFMKAEYRRRKKQYAATIDGLIAASEAYEEPIRTLKAQRRQQSDALQRWLFEQFQMLNAQGERRNLIDIFRDTSLRVPPGGAGECCEPRLLQYAYAHQLRPVQMAMFWVGPSPSVEIRHDGRFYPACRGKCLPILRWMLGEEKAAGCDTAAAQQQPAAELPIVYEDADLVVVNKPAGLLSVPGISEYYSVLSIMRHRYPDVDSPFTVHRLDQPTSGLLLVAKTRQAYRELQRQFQEREVKKRYEALLETDAWTGADERIIDLPLYSDPLNRPYQSVDPERGKQAKTLVRYLGQTDGHARVALFPLTGRTHQLRVHCAHPSGLANPILGDNLYGLREARRLYLHAASITFRHPRTGEPMTLTAPAPF